MPWSVTTAGWLGLPAWLVRVAAGPAALGGGGAFVALAVLGALALGCGSGFLLGSRTRGPRRGTAA